MTSAKPLQSLSMLQEPPLPLREKVTSNNRSRIAAFTLRNLIPADVADDLIAEDDRETRFVNDQLHRAFLLFLISYHLGTCRRERAPLSLRAQVYTTFPIGEISTDPIANAFPSRFPIKPHPFQEVARVSLRHHRPGDSCPHRGPGHLYHHASRLLPRRSRSTSPRSTPPPTVSSASSTTCTNGPSGLPSRNSTRT